MSTDFLLPLAILNCGIGLSQCDFRKLSRGKIIPWLSLGAALTAFMYCLATTYNYMYQVTPKDIVAYRLIVVVQNVNDLLTTIFLEYCYIIRLAAFITNKKLRTALFVYVPILLLVYSSCCIAGIMMAFNYPVSEHFYQSTYNAGNLLLSLTNFVSHVYLCKSLMMHLTNKNIQTSNWEVYMPVITTVGLGTSSICGLQISTLGTGLVYWWWTMDILSFFTVNSLIMKYLTKTSSQSGIQMTPLSGNGTTKSTGLNSAFDPNNVIKSVTNSSKRERSTDRLKN
ncbi:hypothetical protein HDV02_003405 [Globomyces sp. JEL0801]|nr:hypothetical protein HDV02_003405 [Globomyces sp. JEL0801]